MHVLLPSSRLNLFRKGLFHFTTMPVSSVLFLNSNSINWIMITKLKKQTLFSILPVFHNFYGFNLAILIKVAFQIIFFCIFFNTAYKNFLSCQMAQSSPILSRNNSLVPLHAHQPSVVEHTLLHPPLHNSNSENQSPWNILFGELSLLHSPGVSISQNGLSNQHLQFLSSEHQNSFFSCSFGTWFFQFGFNMGSRATWNLKICQHSAYRAPLSK